jgi:hypothetical protein
VRLHTGGGHQVVNGNRLVPVAHGPHATCRCPPHEGGARLAVSTVGTEIRRLQRCAVCSATQGTPRLRRRPDG